MPVYTIDDIRERVVPVAIKYNLKAVYLFGSYARGAATEDSDVDLLIDLSGSGVKSLVQLAAVLYDLEAALAKRVDLITTRSLEQPSRMPSELHFRENIRRERIEVYAAA